MAKGDFRLTSVYKIVLKTCKKNVEFRGKTCTFLPKTSLIISCIFYINKEKWNQQLCLIKYVENEISNSKFHKKKNEREERKQIQLENFHF